MRYVVDTEKTPEQALADLTEAVRKHGFGVLHTYDLKQTLSSKGFDLPNACHILEICNPQQALNVLRYFKNFPTRGITYCRNFKIPSSINSEFAHIIQLCGGFYFYTDASWKVGHTYGGLACCYVLRWYYRLNV